MNEMMLQDVLDHVKSRFYGKYRGVVTEVDAPTMRIKANVPAARGGMAAVVILEPRTPREFPPQAERPFMDQISETFFPAVLFVRTGQPTEFRNSDDVLHNVRVIAIDQELMQGATAPGTSYLHQWHSGDVVMWDNRATMHRGRPWPAHEARLMVRTTISATEADGVDSMRLPSSQAAE